MRYCGSEDLFNLSYLKWCNIIPDNLSLADAERDL